MPDRPRQEPFWQAWFDGTAAPNPGRIGLGLVVESPAGVRSERAIATGRHGCNNEAELQALGAVIELAHGLGARRLRVFGDSKAAIDFVNGVDETAILRLRRLITGIQARLPGFEEIEIGWQPRRYNGDADRLSRLALGLAEKIPPAGGGRSKKRRGRK